MDLGDVGVIQRGQELGLAPEAREPIGIVDESLRQHLDRDVPLELGVPRPPDLAHAARADRLDDLI